VNILRKFNTSSTSGLGVIALESRQIARFWHYNIFFALYVLAIGDVMDDNHGNANTAVGRAMHGCMAVHTKCVRIASLASVLSGASS